MAQFEAMLAANRCVLQVAEELNKSFVDALQEASASGSDLTARLCRCSNPSEAAGLCGQWWCERATKFVEQGQQAAQLWLKLYRSAIQSGEAASTSMSEQRAGGGAQLHPTAAAA
jgi:hypothetical protein